MVRILLFSMKLFFIVLFHFIVIKELAGMNEYENQITIIFKNIKQIKQKMFSVLLFIFVF